MKITKQMIVSVAAPAVLGMLLIGSSVSAQTAPAASTGSPRAGWGAGGHMMGRMPGVFGTVSAVSGTSVTVTSKAGPNGTPAAQTYTVDASSATVMKSGAASSVASIAVGDTVMVQGTVSGTSVVAKTIRDGVMPMGQKGTRPQGAPSAPMIQGNGQPVIGGTVAGVSGNTLTVTTAQGGMSYTVDASSAVVQKGNATSSVSAIVAGDKVVVQGTVNGTSVSATSIIDHGTPATSGATGSGGTPAGSPRGFMGAIGGFFQHLFGFF